MSGTGRELSFFTRQTEMFKGVLRSMNNTFRREETVGDSLTNASRQLSRVLRNTTRQELREDFGRLGGDLRDYQRMLHRYNVQNREDLEELVLLGRQFYDNSDEVREMQDNFEDALRDMESAQNKTAKSMSDSFRDNLTLLGIGNVQGSVGDEAMTIKDISNELKKSTGMDKSEMTDFRMSMIEAHKAINEDAGFALVNYSELMENAAKVASELKISDPQVLEKLAKEMTILQNASQVSFETAGKAMEKLEQRGFSEAQRTEFMDSFVNVVEGRKVDQDKVMGAVNTLSDAISTYANGDTALAQEMNKSIMKSATLFETSYLDSEAFLDTFKGAVLNKDPEKMSKLTTQLSQVGMSVADAQAAFVNGTFDEFSAEYIKSVGTLFEKSNGANRGALADLYGIDAGQINKFMENSDGATLALEDLTRSMEEGKGAMSQASEQTKLWHERFLNWMSGITVFGTDLGTIVESIGTNPLQTYAAIMLMKDGFGMATKAGSKLKDMFTSTGTSAGGLGGKLVDGAKATGRFAIKIGTSALTALGAFVTTIWTTVIPAIVAMAKSAWSATGGRLFGGGGGGGRRGRGGRGGRGGTGGNSSMYDNFRQNGLFGGRQATANPTPRVDVPSGGSRLGGIASGAAGKLGLLGALGFGAFNIATADDKSEAVAQTAGGAAGGWAGAAGGAAAGAALGSVVPILGTAAGGVIGGIVGGLGGGSIGSWFGGKVNEWFGGKEEPKPVDVLDVPSYDVGTNYLQQDGLVYAHEGEAIVPAEYNPANGYTPETMEYSGLSEVQNIRQLSNKVNQVEAQSAQSGTSAKDEPSVNINMDQVVKAVDTLTEFMRFWYQDEIQRERRVDRKTDPLASARQNVTSWGV